METTLHDLISHHAVDRRTLAAVHRDLPWLLADGCAPTAADVAVDADCRLRLISAHVGDAVKAYGNLLSAALEASSAHPIQLQRLARACTDGTIGSIEELRHAVERDAVRGIHWMIVVVMVVGLALLCWLSR